MKRIVLTLFLCCTFLLSKPASADIFGGDVVVLTQLLANAIHQLAQLKQIMSTGTDTLGLMRDINRGIQDGLSAIQMLNPKFNPGLYGNLDTADRILAILNDLYGKIPATSAARLEEMQDHAASESIAMNGTLFQFADQADEESRRILAHAQVVNPGGAAKLTAQSIAVLIGVSTQVLRTNSMMLKMMGQNMALTNRGEKLGSLQFKTQYEGVSNALGGLPKDNTLPSLH
jgi:hypothetical protein